MKTLLILVDGMRPDALADVAPAQELMKKSSVDMEEVFRRKQEAYCPCIVSHTH